MLRDGTNLEYFTLNSGVKIPALGCGTNTFGKSSEKRFTGDLRPIVWAVDSGFRFFDSAVTYDNEDSLGLALRKSKVDRQELFLLSKLPTKGPLSIRSPEEVRSSLLESLSRLKTDYLDAYLVHFPFEDPEMTAAVWREMERLYRDGHVRSIGVSNFGDHDLEMLLRTAEITPAMNQRQSCEWSEGSLRLNVGNGVLPIAWAPLSRTTDEAKQFLEEIGKKYGKSWAQCQLRYFFQRGICSIPKSHSQERLKQDLEIFDFELTEEEMAAISSTILK